MLGFLQWKARWYVDHCLPMGYSALCRIFKEFSTSLELIARHKLGIQCQNILDDFLIVDQSISRCKLQLTLFLNLCAEIRVPIATEKIEGPCHILNSAGIELDCMTSSPSFQSIVNIGFYQVIQRKLKL